MHCQPKCKNRRSTLQSFDTPLSADAPKCWVKTHGKEQGKEKKNPEMQTHSFSDISVHKDFYLIYSRSYLFVACPRATDTGSRDAGSTDLT